MEFGGDIAIPVSATRIARLRMLNHEVSFAGAMDTSFDDAIRATLRQQNIQVTDRAIIQLYGQSSTTSSELILNATEADAAIEDMYQLTIKYADGTITYPGWISGRLGNPTFDDWKVGLNKFKIDSLNQRIYQERTFSQTPDGEPVVIDFDRTNHGRGDHVPDHYHIYLLNIRGNPKSNFSKVKLTNGQKGVPGEPPLDQDGNYIGPLK